MSDAPIPTRIVRHRRILAIALPVTIAFVSQNVVNFIDMLMVSTLGESAVAAVGVASFAVFTIQALALSAATGVQVLTAERRQRRSINEAELAAPVNTALLLIVAVVPAVSLLLYGLAAPLFGLLNADPSVNDAGVPYLESRAWSLTFVAAIFAFRGYWTAIERARVFLFTILAAHAINIVLNYALIFGNFGAPALGTTGAGIATTVASASATLLFLLLAWRHNRSPAFLTQRLTAEERRRLLRVGLPYGVQQFLFTAGVTALLWVVGQTHSTENVAAASVVITLTMLVFLPGMGFGIAAVTLVSRAHAAAAADEAFMWIRHTARLAFVALFILGLPMWTVPEWLLSAFFNSPVVREIAVQPLRLVGLTLCIEAVGIVLLNVSYALGQSNNALKLTTTLQWLGFLPAAYLVGPFFGGGLTAIWALQALYRTAQTGALLRLVYRRAPLPRPAATTNTSYK